MTFGFNILPQMPRIGDISAPLCDLPLHSSAHAANLKTCIPLGALEEFWHGRL
jgi:hypothetical protein